MVDRIVRPGCGSGHDGFTLVELAIVLVIVGLIVGGIIVGQSMVQSAAINATLKQEERFVTAVSVFHDKYRYLPGDMPSPAKFGFIARAGNPADGVINDCSTPSTLTLGCETAAFWDDLSKASMTGEQIYTAGSLATSNHNAGQPTGGILPTAKEGGNFQVYSEGLRTMFHLAVIDSAVAGPGISPGISPAFAFNMDSKVDDGKPAEGRLIAVLGRGRGTVEGNPADTSAGTYNDCDALAGGRRIYNTDEDNPQESENKSCQMLFIFR